MSAATQAHLLHAARTASDHTQLVLTFDRRPTDDDLHAIFAALKTALDGQQTPQQAAQATPLQQQPQAAV